ncbi:MAG TPA: dethiobiotin synthase [Verrucomicrobiae bacterium]|nr:dethiobiotin synthase [Verrucomicrobiae bacterium]
MRLLFITGTDTGVGKTVLTALLLAHLRRTGRRALALKPFCSGSRADVTLLRSLQHGELSVEEVNPFYFAQPVAPWVATRRTPQRLVKLQTVTWHIRSIAARHLSGTTSDEFLLVEGCGGLLVPLGDNFTVLDLVARLRCETVIVSRNRLGTINHTLLAVRALAQARQGARNGVRSKVVLMSPRLPDASAATNPGALSALLGSVPLFRLPFLGPRCRTAGRLHEHARRLSRVLEAIIH